MKENNEAAKLRAIADAEYSRGGKEAFQRVADGWNTDGLNRAKIQSWANNCAVNEQAIRNRMAVAAEHPAPTPERETAGAQLTLAEFINDVKVLDEFTEHVGDCGNLDHRASCICGLDKAEQKVFDYIALWHKQNAFYEAAPAPPAQTVEQGLRLTFERFSRINRERCESENGFNHKLGSWSTSDWFLAIVGEIGEAANIAKKLNRYRDGIPGNKMSKEELEAKLRQELGDVFVYLDLLAQSVGISIEDAAVEVFNAKSNELGCPIVIAAALANSPQAAPGAQPPEKPCTCPGRSDVGWITNHYCVHHGGFYGKRAPDIQDQLKWSAQHEIARAIREHGKKEKPQ